MNLKIAYLILKSEVQERWHEDNPFKPVHSDLYKNRRVYKPENGYDGYGDRYGDKNNG